MRRRHFESLAPVCPVCRELSEPRQSPLTIQRIDREAAGQIVEGMIVCTSSSCQREFPIIDGMPILVGPIREFVGSQLSAILGRDDLSETTESLLGDCCGPGTTYETQRQHQSSYVWDHWGQFDPAEPATEPRPGAIARLLASGLELVNLAALPAGPVLDLGCGPGRTAWELAQRTGRLALGVDLNYSLLRTASQALREGLVRYSRRRVGVAYDRREFAVPTGAGEYVDYWAADACNLPLAGGQAALVVALNVLDSTTSPLALLGSIATLLAPGGQAIIACPYDWSTSVTPIEGWLGGHSQRGPGQADAATLLRSLLTGEHPQAIAGLKLVAELDDLPWHVRLHDRSTTHYRVHLVVAQRLIA